eukprot:CAMPEP_0170584602 /NCGR_PEP_ID=MMETSP0224-20130122/8771_1 /TAXON_ID=285029 /ORGANISM="Togula jolla, Strain CCCM 725" /LENGTH=154 /DNA_ID=CAMNT_0010908037 /DNA_START=29 /DNA_END=490 /DNA_ORIENTATION=-
MIHSSSCPTVQARVSWAMSDSSDLPADRTPSSSYDIRVERRVSMLEERVKDMKHKIKELREDFNAQLEKVMQQMQQKESAWLLSSRSSRIGDDFSVPALASLHQKVANSDDAMLDLRRKVDESSAERIKFQEGHLRLSDQVRQIDANCRRVEEN